MISSDYTAIRACTLRGDQPIQFDLYVRVANRLLLYLRKGATFEGERLQKFKEKNVQRLYLQSDQLTAYRSYMDLNLDSAYDSAKGKSLELRAEILQGAQQGIAEDMMESPESEEFYRVGKTATRRFADFVLKEPGAFRAVATIPNHDKSIAHHGVTVGALAAAIAKKMNMVGTYPVNLLMLGCYVHDIEHFHSGIPIAKQPKDFDTIEHEVYQNHPDHGHARMTKAFFYDQTVLNIVLQHEERIDGSGFPKKLKEAKIDPMATITAVANTYDRYTTFENMSHKDALKRLLIDEMGRLSLEHMVALQDALKDAGIV